MQALYKLILFLLFITANTFAATRNIDVEDDEFDPAIMTVNVGDTLVWIWDEGLHTTTSTIIPTGASAWSYSMDSSHTIAFYIVTIPGSYDYQCNYHYSMGMLGHFIATAPTGIADQFENLFSIRTIANEKLEIDFLNAGNYSMNLISLTGAVVVSATRVYNSPIKSESIPITGLPKGIYILNISGDKGEFSKRIIVI